MRGNTERNDFTTRKIKEFGSDGGDRPSQTDVLAEMSEVHNFSGITVEGVGTVCSDYRVGESIFSVIHTGRRVIERKVEMIGGSVGGRILK
jgi:hypothetical protein